MRNGVRPSWWCVLAGLAYGGLLTLAWPPMDLWWLAFLVPAPLVLAGEYVVRNGITARRAGVLVALGALPFWFLQTRWLIDVTIAGYPGLAVYESVYTGLFVALLARTRRARPTWPLWMVAPALWVGLEVLRGDIVLTGYPWFLAAHPLVEAPLLAAPAAIVGAYGVSLLLVILVASALEVGRPGGALSARLRPSSVQHPADNAPPGQLGPSPKSRTWYFRPLTGLVVTLTLWGGLAALARNLPDGSAGTLRVAVIQTNLPQSNKIGWSLPERIADFTAWIKMTIGAADADASGRKPDVIVWPETMFPGDALNAEAVEALTASNLTWPASMLGPEATRPLRCDEFARALLLAQKELGIPMVVGALTMDGLRMERDEGKITLAFDRKYNSAILIADGRIDTERYDKHSLTPFGEAIPYAWRIPALQRAVLALGAGGMRFDLSWGERSGPLHVPVIPGNPTATRTSSSRVRFVTPICFEVVRSTLCRRLVHEGDPGDPVLIVNISNDGWFSDWPEGRAQHFQIARWRCVELGVPMVRSVNTGISGAIDAQGRILAKGVPGPWEGTIESHTSGVLTLDVPVARASTTPFSRWFGNALGYGCLVATAVFILASRRWGHGRRDDALSSSQAQARTPTA